MGAHEIALEQKVAALCRPETYPELPARVEVIETHMSFVFLTPGHAYKLKKPVRYDFLDFSTLELRKRDCDQEVRLNQRLATGIYLGVLPLVRISDNRLRLGRQGEVVEWVVRMQRLPHERMLDECIRQGTLRAAELDRLAERLAHFYRSCAPEPITPEVYRARFATDIQLDRTAFAPHARSLDQRADSACLDRQLAFLERWRPALDDRVRAGRIVEGHGDLRPEHVCLLEPPVVFDCLEFNRGLRVVDPLDELAYLAMECEFLGAASAGARVLDGYVERSADAAPAVLVAFYKARRASLRARLCIAHTGELPDGDGDRWIARANRYLMIARAYAEQIA